MYGVYGSTKEAQNSGGQVNVLNFRNALEAIPGADGTAESAATPTPALQGCVPINVFGFNTISPAALKYVNAPGSLETVDHPENPGRLDQRRTVPAASRPAGRRSRLRMAQGILEQRS